MDYYSVCNGYVFTNTTAVVVDASQDLIMYVVLCVQATVILRL